MRDQTAALAAPTRSYLRSTARERVVGFVAASVFSLIYYWAPLHILAFAACCALRRDAPWTVGALALPLVASLLVPSGSLPTWGDRLLRTWPYRQVPKYFRFEEYHELTDAEVAARATAGERFVFCFHPHGVFPYVARRRRLSLNLRSRNLASTRASLLG